MSDRTAQLLKEALSLQLAERAELAEQLLASLEDIDRQRIDALWAAEAEDRLDAFERGEIDTLPVREVFGEPNSWQSRLTRGEQ